MKTWTFVAAIILFITAAGYAQQKGSDAITAQDLREHLKYLTSTELAGRRTGEEGNRKAAEYLRKQYESYGLQPAGENGSFFQEFEFVDAIKPGRNNSVKASVSGRTIEFTIGKDFTPLGYSSDTTITSPVVFVGYGITADSLQYDDYAGVDVKGKVIAVIRGGPEGTGPGGPFTKYIGQPAKTMAARKHGAVGMILLNSPADSAGDKLMNLTYDRGFSSSGLAVINLTNSAFNELIKASGKDLGALQKQINDGKKPASFELPNVSMTLQTQLEKVYKKSSNVIAFLPGSDPTLRDEILVIGAHFDHLGMGGQGSMKPDTVAIHPGADDNGSGTAGLLELAQYFADRSTPKLKRSVLFISFTGEELGLLGSDWFVNHPTKPIDKMIGMINMDMIGRLKDSVLVIEGMGSSPEWEPLVRKHNADSTFKLRLKQDAFGPSDYTSFSLKKMPVLAFFTNLHEDYHKPSDTWDKINYDGEQKIVQYVADIATEVDNAAARPVFVQTTPPSSTYGSGEYKVTLGLVPDMAADVVGMKISGIRPGSAAEEAGLKENDIIIRFGDSDVKNLYDYTALLGKYKPGDVVTLLVKRGEKEVHLTARFKAKK